MINATTTTTCSRRVPIEKRLPVQHTTLVDQVKRILSTRKPPTTSLFGDDETTAARTSMATPRGPPAVSDNDNDNDNESPVKRRRISKRVSWSNAPQSVVEVEVVSDTDKHNSWYKTEDYSEFVCSAHLDAQRLRNAAQRATSSEALYMFMQGANLSPRGLEKVLQYASSSDEEDSDDSSEDDQSSTETPASASSSSITRGFPIDLHSRKARQLKAQHRQTILLMHRNQKEMGAHKPEELRKFSENSSRWAVETALKLGHIDAQGLI